jgi:hypothetical protein
MDQNVLESMSTIGIIQKISTGYIMLDMFLCMLIPVTLQHLKPRLLVIWRRLMADHDSARFIRQVKFIQSEGAAGYYEYNPDNQNDVLQNAILLYIGSREDIVKQFSVCLSLTIVHAR